MGFSLTPEVSRGGVLEALPEFAFANLGCHYLEIVDPYLTVHDWEGLGYDVEYLDWQKIDLTRSENQLWADMKHNGRNCIRKATKSGVVIEEASDTGFAGDYFAQYEDVLARKSLAPAYKRELVEQLVKYLNPTGNLLLLRARNEEGLCIATGIFLSLNNTAVFWGAASLLEYQILRSNELLAWHGMKMMKARGIRDLHFGGQAKEYKEKLGCCEIHLPRLMKVRYPVLGRFFQFVRSFRSMRFRNWMLRKLG